MPRRIPDATAPVTRRALLGTTAAAAGAVAAGTAPVGGALARPLPDRVPVRQGGTCRSVVPFSGAETVEELYDLRIPAEYGGDNGATGSSGPYYESLGTEALQRPATTVTFLYDGPAGRSLVVVHGDRNGATGGSVSWTLDGVPAGAGWRVRDDYYTDPATGEPHPTNYDRWRVGGRTHAVDWTYGPDNTDGGALGPLGSLADDPLGITPAYNRAAALFGRYYDGRIAAWEFLSAGPDGPERYDLALDRPVAVGGDPCAVAVRVDVRPDDRTNPVNPRSGGVIPVAVPRQPAVDPGAVAVESLRFGPPRVVDAGGGATPAHGGHGGGNGDLVVHFPVAAAGFRAGDRTAKLAGRTRDGTRIYGVDDVRIVGPPGDPGDGGGDEDRGEDEDRDEDKNRDENDGGDGRGSRGGGRGDDEGDDEGEDEDGGEEEEEEEEDEEEGDDRGWD